MRVEVRRQFADTDIMALIGDAHVLVIEDKTGTQHHSDQLARYEKAVRNAYPSRTAVLVYLKTGDQACYDAVRQSGWSVVTRGQLLTFLQPHREVVRHDVLVDFTAYLESVESAVQAFRTTAPPQWGRSTRAWKGFYDALMRELGDGRWDYVPNQRGGFIGFWWGWQAVDGGKIYLQLEEELLCVKVHVHEDERRRSVRDEWTSRFPGEREGLKFRRPPRLGSGKYMTVAHVLGDYRVQLADGTLDLDATARLLRTATEVVRGLTAPT